jgi:uncharacterized membrane protein YphA (DoxX/SURF4 family)
MNALKDRIPTVARLLLGTIFFVFGLNGFLGFLPQPPVSAPGGAFLGALAATGYMFPLIKGIEVIAGALLLGNRYVPLALTLLAPIVVNIFAFHLFLSPGLALPTVVLALELYLAFSYRDAFRGVLSAQAPTAARREARPDPELAGVGA